MLNDMDSAFIYNKYVTGKNFIGRKSETTILGNLISGGESIALYAPPKSGKTSLIQQALFNLRIQGKRFNIGELSLLTTRSTSRFAQQLGDAAIRAVASTPAEYSSIVTRHLTGTHFVFDQSAYSEKDEVLSLNWDIDKEDIRAVLRLPYLLAEETGTQLIMILDDFQNILLTEDGEGVCSIFEKVMKEMHDSGRKGCTYLICGNMVNAMKYIFEYKRFFYRQVVKLEMKSADDKEIVEHITKGFLSSGKVIDRDLLVGAARLFKNNLWYMNHFAAISDSLSKGYIMENVLVEALSILLSVHEPRFVATMNDLTTFQVSMLKAILDGNTKFSTSEVISAYGLNSSANVRRLKDALCKKEIITFNEKDEPSLLDPLFEYWVRKYYFKMPTE